ncbi:hypothetical protein FHX77_000805 [Bifidobacterium commune]|uniref:hypothetical protein n=1 Tax=Bifidobacterium commune TaxID=1505727 RepID=UPI0013562FE2|nr:hypothetical protein [Bifidobacterium commune]MBB2955396.1 hypothetical protein [Bifidobacterium commune]
MSDKRTEVEGETPSWCALLWRRCMDVQARQEETLHSLVSGTDLDVASAQGSLVES